MIIPLIIYNVLLLLLSPIAVLYILWGLVISDKSRRGMGERLGFISRRKLPATGRRVWLHAVSVGETVAAAPIWKAVLEALPGWHLLHSTTTDTGQAMARRAVGEQGQVIYFPFDFLPCVWLALRRVKPELIVLVETELWPNYLAVAKLLGCKVMVVNGRISDRSLKGAARVGVVYRWMTRNVDRFCMQSAEDAARIIRLGADPARVTVVGNSKFEQVVTEIPLGEQVTLRDALGLTREEPLLSAGSTHPGEEEIILSAFRQVKSAIPAARLIIAPRDIHRAQKVEELAAAHGFTSVRRTKIGAQAPVPDAVIILDTIGELARAYALCTAAFVGGSLVPLGGHNVLEPIALGTPVLFGPNMSNFRDIAAITLEAGVGVSIRTADELAQHWLEYLSNPERCREIRAQAAAIFAAYAGASQRCAEEARCLATGQCPTVTASR